MTVDPKISRLIITLLSYRDNPASVSKAIEFILSLYPDGDSEDLIYHIQCVDVTGRVIPHEETGLIANYAHQGRLAGCVTDELVADHCGIVVLVAGGMLNLIIVLNYGY